MKRFSLFVVISTLVLSLMFVPVDFASAQIADGTYDVQYEMKEANNNNTSIADGYFQKPAKLTVSGGKQTIQLTVTSADMVQSLSAPGGSMKVVSESGDKRTYSFQVSGDLSQPVKMNMHIIVPDLPELPGGYDRQHTARAVFDVSSLPTAKSAGSDNGNGEGNSTNSSSNGGSTTDESTTSSTEKEVDNPKTGDNSPIVLYTILLIGAAGAFILVRKLRTAND